MCVVSTVLLSIHDSLSKSPILRALTFLCDPSEKKGRKESTFSYERNLTAICEGTKLLVAFRDPRVLSFQFPLPNPLLVQERSPPNPRRHQVTLVRH